MEETYLVIKNWRKYQHYSDRCPPWIKLHSKILDKPEWRSLSDSLKGQLAAIWVLAARLHDAPNTDAVVPGDASYLAALTGCKITDKTLQMLTNKGYLTPCTRDASGTLSECYSEAETEAETEADRRAVRRRAAKEILAFLNEKAGRNYKAIDTNIDPIMARINEDATAEECRQIIARKCAQWGNDEKMNSYLRPETLFGKKKFWQYHGELGTDAGLQLVGGDRR